MEIGYDGLCAGVEGADVCCRAEEDGELGAVPGAEGYRGPSAGGGEVDGAVVAVAPGGDGVCVAGVCVD